MKINETYYKKPGAKRSISRYKIVLTGNGTEVGVVPFNYFRNRWETTTRLMKVEALLANYDKED